MHSNNDFVSKPLILLLFWCWHCSVYLPRLCIPWWHACCVWVRSSSSSTTGTSSSRTASRTSRYCQPQPLHSIHFRKFVLLCFKVAQGLYSSDWSIFRAPYLNLRGLMTRVIKPKIKFCFCWWRYKVTLVSLKSSSQLVSFMRLISMWRHQHVLLLKGKAIMVLWYSVVSTCCNSTDWRSGLGCEGCALWFCLKIIMCFPLQYQPNLYKNSTWFDNSNNRVFVLDI